jgi:ethanolamine ammonia-lyase large subunit
MTAEELRRLFALASPFKEGDLLVGGTRDDVVRAEARRAILGTTLAEIDRTPLVADGVSEALARSVDRRVQKEVAPLTIERVIRILLDRGAPEWVRRHQAGLTSEAIAAATKVMTDDELSTIARQLFNALPGEGVTVGSPHHFGSRIQPNSSGDRDDEILFSTLEGLAHGCGDVIIGLNPAGDDLDTIIRLEELLRRIVERLRLPTRYCVLADLPKQHAARQHVRVDVGFQSLAGTSRALRGMVALDVDGLLDLASSFDGLYFETGQGSAVTNGAAEDVDMVTLESRAYGVARHIGRHTGAWMIVNDVAGFIGPEVFSTPEQLERACLEDMVMAKLHGLTMGLDVCATFHMGVPPGTLKRLTDRIVERAAPAYLMAVAGNSDPMLGYLTTSFRDHQRLRRVAGRGPASAMRRRLAELGIRDLDAGPGQPAESAAILYRSFQKAGGDMRSSSAIEEEGRRTLQQLRERGLELGRDDPDDVSAERGADARLAAIYRHARLALYAALDEGVLRDACPRYVRVRSNAIDRHDYLAHPRRGERLYHEDAVRIAGLYASRRTPQVQLVISDGLNANAVHEHLRVLLPHVRHLLREANVHVGEIDVVIDNGRVRAGYHVGELLDAVVIVHIIGERPGTGLDTVSAYISYGRNPAGGSRWAGDFDHSWTTAVCSIHQKGKPAAAAAGEIASVVRRALQSGHSGVTLPHAR